MRLHLSLLQSFCSLFLSPACYVRERRRVDGRREGLLEKRSSGCRTAQQSTCSAAITEMDLLAVLRCCISRRKGMRNLFPACASLFPSPDKRTRNRNSITRQIEGRGKPRRLCLPTPCLCVHSLPVDVRSLAPSDAGSGNEVDTDDSRIR